MAPTDRATIHASLDELLAARRELRPVDRVRSARGVSLYLTIDQAGARALAAGRPS